MKSRIPSLLIAITLLFSIPQTILAHHSGRGHHQVQNPCIMSGVDNNTFSHRNWYTQNQSTITVPILSKTVTNENAPKTVTLGDTQAQVEALFGKHTQVIENWYIYHTQDYKTFNMIYYNNGKVAAVYTTNTAGIDEKTLASWSLQDKITHKTYTDSNDNNIIYAVYYHHANSANIKVPLDPVMILELTNAFRARHNMHPLIWNESLATAATNHAKNMHHNNFFSHTDHHGYDPSDRVKSAGYPMLSVGENIAYNYGSSVANLDGWINSSGHRNNLLSKTQGITYADLGVGIYKEYAVQNFGQTK